MARQSVAPKHGLLDELERANAPTVRPPMHESGMMKKVASVPRAEPANDDALTEDELFAIWRSRLE